MRFALLYLCLMLFLPGSAEAQVAGTDSVIALTLRADLRRLFRDRNPDTTIWRGATLSWDTGGATRTVPIRVRTRGLFRLKQCDFPPIRLRFDQDSVRGTTFSHARRPKLVTHCMNRDDYEQYVLQEYAIYRVLRLLTPMAFETRLLRATYEDSSGGRPVTRYAYLTEDPERLAERLHGTPVTREGVRQSELDPAGAALLGLFQYFVANTDWSVPGLHNVALMRINDVIQPVPYDFDWSGVIEAPYARPDTRLPIRTVRERLYRGLCQDIATLGPVLARFEAMKDSITAIYRAVPGLLKRNADRALRYYDDFYADVANRQAFLRSIARECMH